MLSKNQLSSKLLKLNPIECPTSRTEGITCRKSSHKKRKLYFLETNILGSLGHKPTLLNND